MPTKHVFNLTEFSAPRFLLSAFVRKETYLLDVEPMFSPSRKFLNPLKDWLLRTGRVRRAVTLFPHLGHVYLGGGEVYLYNTFGKIEPWQNGHFRFATVAKNMPQYAMAYRSLICGHLRNRYPAILILDAIHKRAAAHNDEHDDIRVRGLSPVLRAASRAYGNRPIPASSRLLGFVYAAMNICIVALLSLYSAAWALIRIRPTGVKTEKFQWGVTYYDNDLVTALVGASKAPPLLVIWRQTGAKREMETLLGNAHCCYADGRLSLCEGLGVLKFIAGDAARLLWSLPATQPDYFFRSVTMIHRRAQMRALFARYKVEYFYSRDEDLFDHILRHQELNRIGARSLGNLHGVPHQANLRATFRHISFDLFYVQSRAICRYYADTWPKEMEIVPVSPTVITGGEKIKEPEAKPADIAILAGMYTGNPGFTKIVRDLAKAFPDKTIWLQIKRNYAKWHGEDFARDCSDGLPNVIYTENSLFQVLQRSRYAVSDSSNAALDALFMNIVTFVADVSAVHEECIFREYPGFCVNTADSVISHIRDIEAGTAIFDTSRFDDLVYLTAPTVQERLCADMGLVVAGPDSVINPSKVE